MKYAVPQFIDTEDKILGPLTARQFLIELAMLGLTMDLAETLTLPMSVVWAAIRNWIDQGLV